MEIKEICEKLGLDPDTVSDADKELLQKSFGAEDGGEPEKATQGLVKRLLNALLKSPKKLGEVLKALDEDVTLDEEEEILEDDDLEDDDLDLEDEDAEEYEKGVDEDDLEDDLEDDDDDVSDAEVAEALKRMELEKEGAPEPDKVAGKIRKALRDPDLKKIMDADDVVSAVMKSAGAAFEALSDSVVTELNTLRKQVVELRKAVDGMGSTPAPMVSPTALLQKSTPAVISKEEAAIRKNVFAAQERKLTDSSTAINILKSIGTADWDKYADKYEQLVKSLQA